MENAFRDQTTNLLMIEVDIRLEDKQEPCLLFQDKLSSNMLLLTENSLLHSHRQRETTGIKKLYNSFFVLF